MRGHIILSLEGAPFITGGRFLKSGHMEVVWKDIPSFENAYEVSSSGIVRSKERMVRCGRDGNSLRLKKAQDIRPYLGRDGYLYVFLSYNNKVKHLAIHRILAICFIPNPSNKREVNHINAVRTDNSLSNLEWVTPKENVQHSIAIGNNKNCLPGENNPMAKLTSDLVLKIREAPGSHTAIAREYCVSRRTVGFIKTRQRWKHL